MVSININPRHVAIASRPSFETGESPYRRECDGYDWIENHLYKGPKSTKKRKPPRAMHDWLPKRDASCVFLLWGSGNSGNSENSGKFTTWAMDVPITDAKSEHEIFALLAKQYATRLGFLRRCLSFRRFSRLRPVTVCSNHLAAYPSVLNLSIVSIHWRFFNEILSPR